MIVTATLVKTNIFIPVKPMNGLDLCYHAEAVLTGSGTLAREAACLGVPAVSFYPSSLLAVDKSLIDKGWVFHSRQILRYMNMLRIAGRLRIVSKSPHLPTNFFLNLLTTALRNLDRNV